MAPDAINCTDCPRHILGLTGNTTRAGEGFTTTVNVVVAEQALALVPVIV